METDLKFNQTLKTSELYQCDGLILSPIDGGREIKIKPKSLLTIDLLFNGQIWIDKDNYNWSKNIMTTSKNTKTGRIYRCYPKVTDSEIKFKVGEIRYDKKKPNPTFVINNIINSNEYKKWQFFRLSEKNRIQILVPPGFGNGHQVLSKTAIFHYKQSTLYDKGSQFTIKYNSTNFDWPIKRPILSKRDA